MGKKKKMFVGDDGVGGRCRTRASKGTPACSAVLIKAADLESRRSDCTPLVG